MGDTRSSVPPGDEPAGRIAVRRTGGFAGVVVEGEKDLASEAHGPEIAALLDEIDFDAVPAPVPLPDRFLYHLRIADRELTVAEQDLTPPLRRVVDLVLGV